MAGKKYSEALKKVEPGKGYGVREAIDLIKTMKYSKFDETVEVAFRLGVDPKYSDQQVRSTVVLPNGVGKKVRVLVFAAGDKEKEAKEAGADFVGTQDLADKIKTGWTDFDACVATPDQMRIVGQLGKILGPRGLMPNPKLGTTTFEVSKAVRDLKAGKIEFRAEKAGIVHAPIGKVSFDSLKLEENFQALYDAIMKARPVGAKGTYLKSISVCATMTPGVKIDLSSVKKAEAR
jgi:large subunit ribosomal protein L1